LNGQHPDNNDTVVQGELTPILVQMVKSANTNGLLDNDCDPSKYHTLTRQVVHHLSRGVMDSLCMVQALIKRRRRRGGTASSSRALNIMKAFTENPRKVTSCAI
jgi:hypothetical protein